MSAVNYPIIPRTPVGALHESPVAPSPGKQGTPQDSHLPGTAICRRPSHLPHQALIVLILFLLLALLPSCAPQPAPVTPDISSYWTTFVRHQNAIDPLNDFSIRTSINYRSTTSKHRVIMRLFGSLDYPIRMDLEAGIGRTISMWREDADIWQAYFPEEKRMYTAGEAKNGVRSLGFPSPFDLRELALVLQGKLAPLLPEHPAREELQETGSKIFFARPDRIAWLLVDPQGRPLELQGAEGWRVDFDYRDASPYSQKISMVMDETTSAVIRIKSIGPGTFTTDLAMELPEDTEIIDIDALPSVRTSQANETHDVRTQHPDQ